MIACLSGVPTLEIERDLLGGANIVQLARTHGVSKQRLVRAASENGKSMDLYERVPQTLDSLRMLGTPLGIVSNLPRWLVQPLLESKNLNQYFVTTVTPRWGLPAKPKPQGIVNALEQMGRVADANTWFVGDGKVDAMAAKAAAIKFAWASYGYEAAQPLGTFVVLEKFEDVLRL